MRSQGGGLVGRGGREAKDGLSVARRLRVMREPREVRSPARWIGERGERATVQGDLPLERDRLLDREACELVPEGDAPGSRFEHARAEALLEPLDDGILVECLEKPELAARRYHGDGLEEPRRDGVEPRRTGEDRVAHGCRDLVWSRRERLDDEERVAAGLVEELVRVEAVRVGELRDRSRRERAELPPRYALARRELADDEPEWMGPVELVVAVGGDDQHRNRLDSAREEPEDVERRLVRPVDVLEHEDRRAVRGARERRHHLVRHHVASDDGLELAAGGFADREQRPEWPRDEERIAAAPEDPCRAAVLVAEPPQQRRLADACFAAHEHDTPA